MDLPPMAGQLLAEALRAAIGDDSVRLGPDIEPKHFGDWVLTAAEHDRPGVVVYPRSTDDVAAVLRVCSAHRASVVPQGGLTGLAGGATPVAGCVALSLARMKAIEEVDRDAATMTVQAGATLQMIQEAADAQQMLFPLDIGSRGSCVIGGNVSTNAGGVRVLRYGMARDLVMGMEVVLPDGTVLPMLNKMQKNNTGYDLKQLFVGAEGTLGVVTRLVLRLFPKPASVCTAFCAVADYDAALRLLQRARSGLGGTLSAFEVMWPEFYQIATQAFGRRGPIVAGQDLYILMEAMGTDQARDEAQFSAVIEQALEDGVVIDAAIAQSGRQVQEIWDIRDSVAEFSRTFHPHVGFDVSVPVGKIGHFVEATRAGLQRKQQGIQTLWFGHAADSNLHVCVKQDPGGPSRAEINDMVYASVCAYGGSVSAEHGIGLLKKSFLPMSRSADELNVMRKIKAVLDPQGIMNPGKIFD